MQLARSRQPKVLDTLLEALENGDVGRAQELSTRTTDLVLRVIHAGLNHRHSSLQGALQAAAGIELRAAGRYLTAMDTIITLAPLLGLRGAVTGIMGSFQSIGVPLPAQYKYNAHCEHRCQGERPHERAALSREVYGDLGKENRCHGCHLISKRHGTMYLRTGPEGQRQRRRI